MGYTDNCDIFASFSEQGFNGVIRHVMQQRPSLFNYATADVAKNPELWCEKIVAHPIVSIRHNPFLTIVDPLPIPGTRYGVNFVAQLTDLEIDFHPGNLFNLPPELSPLKEQLLAIKLSLCAGLGCPPKETVDRYIPPPREAPKDRESKPGDSVPIPIIPLPTRHLHCFCLDAYATAGMRIVNYDGKEYLEPFLQGFEITDIRPPGLEDSLECYISLILSLSILPGLRMLLNNTAFNLTQGAPDLFPKPTNIVLSPMPLSPGLPNNPAIEKDLLKIFIKAEVI